MTTSWSQGERLYALLPAVHRIRDVEQGGALRALLSVIEAELETLEADIERLGENWFIETCDAWVVPYIGDLVGSRPLHDIVRPRRADVAKTIYYRRRKATVPMLAELARDVTGWDAHVVEFFRLLVWNQSTNHLRMTPGPNPLAGTRAIFAAPMQPGTRSNPDVARLDPSAHDAVGNVLVRNRDALDRREGPFDALSHTVDVRGAGAARDRYHMRRIGIFLWRLESYGVRAVTPAPSASAVDGPVTYGFYANPLGVPAPLANQPETEEATSSELRVGGYLRPLALHEDLEQCRIAIVGGKPCESAYVSLERSLWIERDGASVAPERIVVMDLATWHRAPSSVRYRTDAGAEITLDVDVGVDPSLGRIVFAPGREPVEPNALRLWHSYAFSADLGGGPYRRRQGADPEPDPTWSRTVSRTDPSADHDDLQAALDAWGARSAPQADARIEILDSATYAIDAAIAFQDLATAEGVADGGERLVIRAADAERPCVRMVGSGGPGGELAVTGAAGVDEDQGRLVLDGLWLEGGVRLVRDLRELTIRHCTLVPGRQIGEDGEPLNPGAPSVSAAGPITRAQVIVEHAILGPIALPEDMVSLSVRDSIIDAMAPDALAIAADPASDAPGPPATLERVTVLGRMRVRELVLASETIFDGKVEVERRQSGCVRFSYVEPGSVTPRRHRCQPDTAVATAADRELVFRLRQAAISEARRRHTSLTPEMLAVLKAAVGDEIRAEVERRVEPSFASRRYGDPAYGQLGFLCPEEIARGAENGSEMGAFGALMQPQREADLVTRLAEYLPFGLEPTKVFVT